MGHAKVLADFEVQNPQKWAQRIEQEKLSIAALKKRLAKEKGKYKGGGPRSS